MVHTSYPGDDLERAVASPLALDRVLGFLQSLYQVLIII